jgi:beta-ribofuranosylaminobenzene 5'-phosphate synthase
MLATGTRLFAADMTVEIRAHGRIHAGLIDLSGRGYRVNGGVGWAIEGPELVVRARRASRMHVKDLREWPISAEEIDDICRMLESFAREHGVPNALIEVSGDLPAHRGLGGGTAMRLAALEALATITGIDAGPEALVAASYRGGTSGIGVRTYFEGGLVMDLGHRQSAAPGPSRDRKGAGQSLSLVRLDMPDWEFGLCSPHWLESIPIEAEREIFAGAISMAAADVRDALYEVVFGMVAAAAEGDRETFIAAIDALQRGAWKRTEWASHSSELALYADALRSARAKGVGLSSVGPTLYFIWGALERSALPSSLASCIRPVRASNRGRAVRIIADA